MHFLASPPIIVEMYHTFFSFNFQSQQTTWLKSTLFSFIKHFLTTNLWLMGYGTRQRFHGEKIFFLDLIVYLPLRSLYLNFLNSLIREILKAWGNVCQMILLPTNHIMGRTKNLHFCIQRCRNLFSAPRLSHSMSHTHA